MIQRKGEDIIGKTYNSLTVISQIGAFVDCLCDCGNTHETTASNLRTGNTKWCYNCSLLQKSKNHKTHGQASFFKDGKRMKTKEYNTWQNIKSRCYYKKDKRYSDYGGRGISVCKRWVDSFENFFEDMGVAPTKEHQIDRIENDGNYEQINCRWATLYEQANNKRDNVFLTLNDITKTASQWSRELNINADTITARKRQGWSDKRCLTIEVKTGRTQRKVEVDSVIYDSVKDVAKHLQVKDRLVYGRIASKNFKEWNYI